jgi:regulator of protease activity HflC (stomatin/prohibitin superfamily)
MILFILGVLSVLVALVCLGGSRLQIADDEGMRGGLVIFGLIGVVVGVLLMFAGSAYSQDPGEVVVIKTPGGDIKTPDTTPGWGFTAPWNSRITFNIRNQRIEMFSNDGGEGQDGAAISAPLENGSNVSVSVTVRYGIKPECVGDIYRTHRSQGNLLDNVLKPGLRDEMRVATTEYTAFEVKQNSAALAATLVTELNDRWEEDCVEVDNVDLGQLRLPEATEAALDAVNERQLQQESARADLERARIEAETVKTEAQAQADADQIIRCGATTTTETQEVNGEDTEVVIVTPKVGSDCENRLNTQVLLNNLIDKLDEIGSNGTLILPESLNSLLNIPTPSPQPQG